MADALQSTKDYELTVAVTADRLGDRPIFIERNVVELHIFERMDMLFLTAQMLVKDDLDMYNKIDFMGTEKVSIDIRHPSSDRIISKKFVVEQVERVRKINDQVEMLSIRLIEQRGYDNFISRFSKAYTGKPWIIMSKILTDQMGLTLNSYAEMEAQPEMRVVIPYLTVFEAVEMIRKRMATANGSPFFVYSPLNFDNIIIKDLDTILKQPAWNANGSNNKPFLFSSVRANATNNTPDDFEKQSYNIQSFVYRDVDNTLSMIKNGSVGSYNSFTDMTTGITVSGHLDIEQTIAKINSEVLPTSKQLKFDTAYLYKGDPITLYNSAYPHTLLSNNSYSDMKNLYHETDIGKLQLNATASTLTNLLFKNVVEISIPGLHFITGQNKSIGQVINVFFMSSDVAKISTNNVPEEEIKDKKKSGDYLIYSMRHVFTLGKHNVVAEAVKLRYDRGE